MGYSRGDKVNDKVDEIVKLYFQGCSVEKAIKIIKTDIKKEVLERLLKNYEYRMSEKSNLQVVEVIFFKSFKERLRIMKSIKNARIEVFNNYIVVYKLRGNSNE